MCLILSNSILLFKSVLAFKDAILRNRLLFQNRPYIDSLFLHGYCRRKKISQNNGIVSIV